MRNGADQRIGAILSEIRGSVRSAHAIRPRTGSRTSADKAANSTRSPVWRGALASGVESPSRMRAEESGTVFTKW